MSTPKFIKKMAVLVAIESIVGTIVLPVATSLGAAPSACAYSSAVVNTCLRPAFTTWPLATNVCPTAGARQFTEKCDASTRPDTVAAANPHTVSSMAAMSPACKKPAYCPMSSARQTMRNSAVPTSAWSTSKPAQRLKAALALTA